MMLFTLQIRFLELQEDTKVTFSCERGSHNFILTRELPPPHSTAPIKKKNVL
jgi:hypothetical protein